MIIDRYMLRIWLGPFVGGVLVVFFVMLLARALKLFQMVMDNPDAWSFVASLLVLTIPFFLLQIVPIAFFLSLQNAISSLQQNSEMDALRASGMSYARIFRVFLLLGIVTYISMFLMPQSQLGFNNTMVKIYAMKGGISFSPQRFTHGMDGITVYVEGEDDQGRYHGVMLEDSRDGEPVIYTAESARFQSEALSLILKLDNGVRLEGEGADQPMLAFEHYTISIPMPGQARRMLHSGDHVSMMGPGELWQALQRDAGGEGVAEWNRRMLMPTTVLVLLAFALPLSLSQKRSGKAGSFIAGIGLLLVVYNTQLVLQQQVTQGSMPGWSMWLGQLALLASGIFLSVKSASGHVPRFFSLWKSA